MNNQKPTPGPWRAEPSKQNKNAFVFVDSEHGRQIAQISGANMQEEDANARLIAATPELYDACKAMIYEWISVLNDRYQGTRVEQAINQCKEAISKAEG